MPRGDQTGPEGMGTMTGRRLGYCAGYDSPGYTKGVPRGGGGFGAGRGHGFGRGFGRGFRGGFEGGYSWRGVPAAVPAQYPVSPTYPTKEQELDALKENATYLKQNMENINNRIKELESKNSDK